MGISPSLGFPAGHALEFRLIVDQDLGRPWQKASTLGQLSLRYRFPTPRLYVLCLEDFAAIDQRFPEANLAKVTWRQTRMAVWWRKGTNGVLTDSAEDITMVG
jgi:hypothetical protein